MAYKLDHVVIHVSDWERSNAFYRDVLGAEVVPRGAGFAYKIGDIRLNCHGPGIGHVNAVAKVPVMPGNSDICFEWEGPIDGAAAHLPPGACRWSSAGRHQWRARPGHLRLFPRSRRLAAGIPQLSRPGISVARYLPRRFARHDGPGMRPSSRA